MSHTLSLTNKKVFDFYEEHKNLNFENMNVIFVEILENLLKNANPTLDVSLATSLLDGIKGLQNQFNNINDAVTKNLNEVSTIFTLKFVDFKKEYMQDLQMRTYLTKQKLCLVISYQRIKKLYRKILRGL